MIPVFQKSVEWFSNKLSRVNFVNRNKYPTGMMTYTKRFIDTEPSTKFFINDTVGNNMAQNIAFGSNSVNIHDGGTTASLLTGTATSQNDNHLLDSGETFSEVEVGMWVVEDGGAYAEVTAVGTNDLTLSANIFPVGNEDYTIEPEWADAATVGSWNFATDISLTDGDNNDRADFTTIGTIVYTGSLFTALTGKVTLITYSAGNSDITLLFELAGVLVGNSVSLEDFIDTGDFTQQSFAIPLSAFGVEANTFDGFAIIYSRSGGPKGAIDFDDLQIEKTGAPLVFELPLDSQDIFHVSELTFAYANGNSAFVVVDADPAGTAETSTLPGISYDKILGLAALPIGFLIKRTKNGKVLFQANIRTLGAHRSAGARADDPWSDGTNTFITLRVAFPDALIITGDSEDQLTVTINDPMNGLLQFTASARGSLEV